MKDLLPVYEALTPFAKKWIYVITLIYLVENRDSNHATLLSQKQITAATQLL